MDNSSPLNPLAASTGTLLSYFYKERNFSGAAAPGEIPGEIPPGRFRNFDHIMSAGKGRTMGGQNRQNSTLAN